MLPIKRDKSVSSKKRKRRRGRKRTGSIISFGSQSSWSLQRSRENSFKKTVNIQAAVPMRKLSSTSKGTFL